MELLKVITIKKAYHKTTYVELEESHNEETRKLKIIRRWCSLPRVVWCYKNDGANHSHDLKQAKHFTWNFEIIILYLLKLNNNKNR